MASPQLITRDNFTTLLKRSTQGREGAGVPDGNIYLDAANDRVEIITLSEVATIDLGSGLEPNPLTDTDKIQSLALYFFILQEVQADPTLQNFAFAMDAVSNRMGKLVGATAFLSSIKLASGAVDVAGVGGALGDDRLKLADSGFQEFAVGSGGNTLIDRIYHGAKSLNTINSAGQPFYQIAADLTEAARQAAAPIDFSKPGAVNEVIQTFGSTANGDTGAGDFDNRTSVLILGVRQFGYSIGEVNSQATGVSELGAYSQGYGLGNSAVSAIQAITQADVWGGAQVAPYTGLSFTRLATPEVVSGWVEADGNFTDKILNASGATLIQVRAWLDMLMQQDSDQNANTGTTGAFLPKRAEPLYTIDPTGKLVTRKGLMIEGIPAADQQNIIMTDDSGAQKTYPVVTPVVITLSASWFADTSGWFRLLYTDGAGAADFDTAGAVTAKDSSSVDIAGDKLDSRIFPVSGAYELRFSYAYDTNTQAGLSAGVDKPVTLLVGGVDATKSKAFTFIISNSALSVDASTDAETN